MIPAQESVVVFFAKTSGLDKKKYILGFLMIYWNSSDYKFKFIVNLWADFNLFYVLRHILYIAWIKLVWGLFSKQK